MDDAIRWMLVASGLALGSAGIYVQRTTIPRYVVTPVPAEAAKATRPRPTYVRHLGTALVMIGLIVMLGLILRWQAQQGIPPQPLTIGADARSIGLGMGSLLLILAILQLRTRKGINIDGERALALKQDIDHWLRLAAPGLVDGGSRLPGIVYRNEAVEWTLLLVDDTASCREESLIAELSCATATTPAPQQRELTWDPIASSGALHAQPRWNVALKELGSQEATFAMVPSVGHSTLRLMVEVKSILNLNARQAAIVGVLVSAIGIALTAAGVFG